MSKAGFVGFLVLLAIVAVVLAGSMGTTAHRCEVCMQYNGQTQCRTVEAATLELAREGAVQNACAIISSGVTGTLGCQRSAPLRESCR